MSLKNISGLKREDFQAEVQGKQTDLFILRNNKGCEVAITNYGGALVAIMVPDRDGKMACINFPTVVAAMTLYNSVPKNRKPSADKIPLYQTREQYLAKAKEIYDWGVENLFNKQTGRIADSRHGQHEPAWKTHVYNQATFIGASVLLYKATGDKKYLDNAILATEYIVNGM